MSLAISFESASSAVCYAEEAVPRALRRGCAAPDIMLLRIRINRSIRAKRIRYAQSIDDPTPALAKYARKCLQEGGNITDILTTWGCTRQTVHEALRAFPEEPEQISAPRPVLLLLTEVSSWSMEVV